MIINESILLPSLSVPALPEHLHVVRATTRAVVAHRTPNPDDVVDLVLAVNEAAILLLSHACASCHLTCIFDIDAQDCLRVQLSTTTPEPIDMSTTSFTWFVLQALVDDVILEHIQPAGLGENFTATIILRKSLPLNAAPAIST